MTGQDIYDSFTNNNLGFLHESARAVALISINYAVREIDLVNLTGAMENAWQGEAAGAAERGVGPLTVAHVKASPQIDNAAASMRQQAAAFESAKRSVVPVPAMPDEPGIFDNVFSLGGASRSFEHQMAAIQSANNNNIRVMTAYENATAQNQAVLTGIPEALPPVVPTEDGRIVEPPGSRDPGRGGSGGQSGSGGGAAATTSSQQQQFSPASSTPGAELAQTRAESTHTAASGLSSTDTGSPRPAPTPPPEGSRSGLPLGPFGGGYGPTRGGGQGGPRGSGVGAGPRGSGAGGGTRMPGGAGEPGGRGGGGMGARGPASAEGPLGRGAAGRAGAPGGSGPVGGRKRGEDDEDLEHQRPAFLVEADPDELFGNDTPSAPPVIGG
jgi:hypothetical protein